MSHAHINYSYIKTYTLSTAQFPCIEPHSFHNLDGTILIASFSVLLYSSVVRKSMTLIISVLKKDPFFVCVPRKPAHVTLRKLY